MGSLTVRQFVSKIAEDAAFRKQLGITEQMPLAEFRAKAAAAGYDYSEAELLAEARSLSDADLDGVSGGVASDAHALRAVQDGADGQLRQQGEPVILIRPNSGEVLRRA
ncbi:MAG: Nif11-like leader peptide family natural product precursor [Deltaproteobacteria bacterium]|nr:Nif11-like leader peptide family natural product precursor [Deltaproteobacteria bacterium]